jgi:hypothetical protein
LRAALLSLSAPTTDPSQAVAWSSLGEPRALPFSDAMTWIHTYVTSKGGNWWDLFNAPGTEYERIVYPAAPSPEVTQDDISDPIVEDNIRFPLPQRSESIPNTSSTLSLPVTITTDCQGKSVMSFTLPDSVAMSQSIVPTPSRRVEGTLWPFGTINTISGIVGIVEVGKNGLKLPDWRPSSPSGTQKKCNYMLLYNHFKSSVIGSDYDEWKRVFDNPARAGRVMSLTEIQGKIRREVASS